MYLEIIMEFHQPTRLQLRQTVEHELETLIIRLPLSERAGVVTPKSSEDVLCSHKIVLFGPLSARVFLPKKKKKKVKSGSELTRIHSYIHPDVRVIKHDFKDLSFGMQQHIKEGLSMFRFNILHEVDEDVTFKKPF